MISDVVAECIHAAGRRPPLAPATPFHQALQTKPRLIRLSPASEPLATSKTAGDSLRVLLALKTSTHIIPRRVKIRGNLLANATIPSYALAGCLTAFGPHPSPLAMLEPLLISHPALALLRVLAYLADFALTLHTARLYQAHVRPTISFGGSFELTPAFQADVDRLNGRSRRFWLALLLSTVLIVLVWVLSVMVLGLPAFFTFLIGALVLRQAAVLVRHLRNLVLFRAIRNTAEVTGQLSYARPLVLRLSAVEFAAFSVLYLFVGIATSSWFVLGGALACAIVCLQHLRLARAAPPPSRQQRIAPAAEVEANH